MLAPAPLLSPLLSVVTPVYRAEGFIEAFHARMSAAAGALTPDYELIYVHDASPDASLARLLALQRQDARMVVVDLARNLGQHRAIRAGLAEARGAHVFVLDDDLQDQPEWLGEFFRVLQAEGAEVVMGVQRARRGGVTARLRGPVFHVLLRYVCRVALIRNLVTARLMTRRYVQALLSFPEAGFELTVAGMQTGLARALVTVDKPARRGSSYTLGRKLRFFSQYVVTATTEPLHWVLPSGLACCAVGLGLGYGAWMQEAPPEALRLSRWLLASVWMVGGAVLLGLGCVALYVARLCAESRPQAAAVRAVHGRKEAP